MAYPLKYTEALADEICELLATTPRGLHFILDQDDRFPHHTTWSRWAREIDGLAKKVADARREQSHLLFYESIEIADDGSQDAIVLDKGTKDERVVLNTEFVQRSRLRVDTRLKMAAKLNPREYGEKIDLNARVGMVTQDEAIDELD